MYSPLVGALQDGMHTRLFEYDDVAGNTFEGLGGRRGGSVKWACEGACAVVCEMKTTSVRE